MAAKVHHLFESGNLLAGSSVELFQFRNRKRADCTTSIGCPVHGRVVHYHRRTIRAYLDIEFRPMAAKLDGTSERAQRVFRRAAARAAMANDLHKHFLT